MEGPWPETWSHGKTHEKRSGRTVTLQSTTRRDKRRSQPPLSTQGHGDVKNVPPVSERVSLCLLREPEDESSAVDDRLVTPVLDYSSDLPTIKEILTLT